jgi:hypothetical protein
MRVVRIWARVSLGALAEKSFTSETTMGIDLNHQHRVSTQNAIIHRLDLMATYTPPPMDPIIPRPTPPDRLSIPFSVRLPLLTFVAGGAGACLGLAHGSTETSLRFRAENAHRLPTSQTGWYLYHKSKNYHVILGGLKEGGKMSVKVGFWSGVFVLMEEGVDRGRAAGGRMWRDHAPKYRGLVVEEGAALPRDFISTAFAGLGTAGLFSAWNQFPLPTAVRVMKLGGKAGLAFGLAQDAVSWAKGNRLGYVEFVKRFTVGTGDRDTGEAKVQAVG